MRGGSDGSTVSRRSAGPIRYFACFLADYAAAQPDLICNTNEELATALGVTPTGQEPLA
jgi:hypothetical protein